MYDGRSYLIPLLYACGHEQATNVYAADAGQAGRIAARACLGPCNPCRVAAQRRDYLRELADTVSLALYPGDAVLRRGDRLQRDRKAPPTAAQKVDKHAGNDH